MATAAELNLKVGDPVGIPTFRGIHVARIELIQDGYRDPNANPGTIFISPPSPEWKKVWQFDPDRKVFLEVTGPVRKGYILVEGIPVTSNRFTCVYNGHREGTHKRVNHSSGGLA